MIKTVLFLPLLAIAVLAQTQTSLSGYATLQNSGNKSAHPAQVKSFGATDTDVRSEDGFFLLQYGRKQPGDDITLEVFKEGYEVVNTNALSARLGAEGERKLKVFLCPLGQWRRYADEYYGTHQRIIYDTYRQKLAEVQQQYADVSLENQGYRDALSRLAEEREAALALAESLSERLAKTNLDDETGRYVKAFHLFVNGELDAFFALMDEADILADLAKAEQAISRGEELIRIGSEKLVIGREAKARIVEEFMIKGRAHIIKFEWAEAERAFEIAVEADSADLKNRWELADFLTEQNQKDMAVTQFQKCLALAVNEGEKADILNNLGNLFGGNRDYPEAIGALEESLEIFEHLAQSNSKVFEPKVAVVFNNFGVLYRSLNDGGNAEKAYLKALEIRKRLAGNDRAGYEPVVAETLNNLGNLYSSQNDYPRAAAAYMEALEIRKRLAQSEPAIHEPYLSDSYNNLGNLYSVHKEYEQAETAYLIALEIYKRLALNNPAAYEPSVATTLNNMGNLYSDKEEWEKAETAYRECLALRKRLAQNNPAIYEPLVAQVQNNIGNFYHGQKDFAKAEAALTEARDIYQRLAANAPEPFEPYVAGTQNNLGILLLSKRDHANAKVALLEALSIGQRLAQTDSAAYEPLLVTTQKLLGDLYRATNEPAKAQLCYTEVLHIYRRLAATQPDAYELDVAEAQTSLALLYLDQNKREPAEGALKEALRIYRQLAIQEPLIYDIEVARIAIIFAMSKHQSGKTDQALPLFFEALRAADRQPQLPLSREISNDVINTIGLETADPALAEWLPKGAEAAKEVEALPGLRDKTIPQRKLVEVWEEAYRLYPDNPRIRNFLAREYGNLSWYLLFSEDFPEAESAARYGLQMDGMETWIVANLANALLFQGLYMEAESIYRQFKGQPYNRERTWTDVFLEDLDTLEATGITHPDVKKARSFLKE